MSGDTANPRVWINADAYRAPLGTTAPTDTSAAWPAGWDPFGLLSEDGITEQRADTLTDMFAYGGILVRTTRSKHKRTIKVICLEDNPIVFATVNPGSTASTAGGVTTRTVKVPNTNRQAFGLEVRDGDITKRIVIPAGEVMSVGDAKFADAEMTMKELDINVYPDADGVLYYELTDDAQAA